MDAKIKSPNSRVNHPSQGQSARWHLPENTAADTVCSFFERLVPNKSPEHIQAPLTFACCSTHACFTPKHRFNVFTEPFFPPCIPQAQLTRALLDGLPSTASVSCRASRSTSVRELNQFQARVCTPSTAASLVRRMPRRVEGSPSCWKQSAFDFFPW